MIQHSQSPKLISVFTLLLTSMALAAPQQRGLIDFEKIVNSSNPVREVRRRLEKGSDNNHRILPHTPKSSGDASNQNSRKLPKTTRLDGDLQSTRQSLQSLNTRISNIEKSIESARKSAQDVQSTIKTLGRLDDKVYRIKRQLESISKIPQLRILRPLVTNLGKVRDQIHGVRVKADQANRDTVTPLVNKLRNAEKKVETKVREIGQVASQTNQARQKLTQLTSFVSSRGYQRGEVRSLESLSKPVSSTIRPVQQTISQMDRSLSGVDRDFNTVAGHLRNVSKAKSAVQNLDRDLAKADSAARDLDKVLSKTISIKFPKKFSISIRQLLEAPGKVMDIVLKPLQKLADKALKPVLSKFQINIKVPGAITSLTGELDRLKSQVSNVGSIVSKVESGLQPRIPAQFTSQLGKLMNQSTSQL